MNNSNTPSPLGIVARAVLIVGSCLGLLLLSQTTTSFTQGGGYASLIAGTQKGGRTSQPRIANDTTYLVSGEQFGTSLAMHRFSDKNEALYEFSIPDNFDGGGGHGGYVSHWWIAGKQAMTAIITFYSDFEVVFEGTPLELISTTPVGGYPPEKYGNSMFGQLSAASSVYCNLPIPFKSHLKVTIRQASQLNPKKKPNLVWFVIRGLHNSMMSLGSPELLRTWPENVKLQVHTIRNQFVGTLKPTTIVETQNGKRGLLALLSMNVASYSNGYLEGCLRIESNHNKFMLASGTEDYFLGSYYWDSGLFHNELGGLISFNKNCGSFTNCFNAYRVHLKSDPILFSQRLAITWRNGETMTHNKKCTQLDWDRTAPNFWLKDGTPLGNPTNSTIQVLHAWVYYY